MNKRMTDAEFQEAIVSMRFAGMDPHEERALQEALVARRSEKALIEGLERIERAVILGDRVSVATIDQLLRAVGRR